MNATQSQFDFIKSLLSSRDLSEEAKAKVERARLRARQGVLTRAQASDLIDTLKSLPTLSLEGMHQLPNGDIYKVQLAVHGSGRPYAKRLHIANDGTVWFEMERGALRHLSESTRMTTEQASAFGQLYGVCCNCGRTLTDEESIARGIGPVCAEYFI